MLKCKVGFCKLNFTCKPSAKCLVRLIFIHQQHGDDNVTTSTCVFSLSFSLTGYSFYYPSLSHSVYEHLLVLTDENMI